jgi:hypothetical protein
VSYLDDYWSDISGRKYGPSVLEVFQLLKYFGNFSTFISHGILENSKTAVISCGNTMFTETIPCIIAQHAVRSDFNLTVSLCAAAAGLTCRNMINERLRHVECH